MRDTPSLPGYAVFAAMLASAGLPIYIHAPKFYVDTYGVSLTALAAVLFGLRLFDVVQDPLLGWLVGRLRVARRQAVLVGAGVIAASMVGLFAIAPPLPPLVWFTLTMVGLFSSFSFLTIAMYSEGVTAAARVRGGHLKLAAWRETGALLGVCVASIAPFVLGFTGFAVSFVVLTALAFWLMRAEWGAGAAPKSGGFGPVLRDPLARRLLLIALLNAAPVAVSSTLFLFYVQSVLQAGDWAGAFLILFFITAAGSAPVWSALATPYGSRRMLFFAMGLAIAGFAGALTLGPGDTIAFAIVCLITGFALGADFALLPAAFAARLEAIAPDAGEAFGLWNFVSKATLAIAAITLLPSLEAAGFRAGGTSSEGAIVLLAYLYAGVPCVLKLGAMALLGFTPLPGDE